MKTNQNSQSNMRWWRVPVMPEVPDADRFNEFPDSASGVRDLDRRAGLKLMTILLIGASVVIGALLVLMNL